MQEDNAMNMGDPAAYKPDWKYQWNKLTVPCKGNWTHEWVRVGPVTTLGQLFLDLGQKYTAKSIYAF